MRALACAAGRVLRVRACLRACVLAHAFAVELAQGVVRACVRACVYAWLCCAQAFFCVHVAVIHLRMCE